MATVDPTKWDNIQKSMKDPVTLSEVEKEKFTKLFESIKHMLDDSLEGILKMDRDDAYRYSQLIVAGFREADTKFAAGTKTDLTVPHDPEQTQQPVVQTPVSADKPNFDEIMSALPKGFRVKAERYLDCVKNYKQLKEALEDPEVSQKEKNKIDLTSILCHGSDRTCSVEEMVKCVSLQDPTVDAHALDEAYIKENLKQANA